MTATLASGKHNDAASEEYPAHERDGCAWGIKFLKWLAASGIATEIGPDAVSVLVAVVTQEDEIYYQRHVTFFNSQLATRCGIRSEHALIRARQRAIDAGLLYYHGGAKRSPGRYWVKGFTAQSAENPKSQHAESTEYTAQGAANPQLSRSESNECTAERAGNPAPSIPNTCLPKNPLPKKRSARFIPPTIDEVRAYCRERKNNVNAEQFVDYYEANGWRRGKTAMKCWRATVRTWERNGFQSSNSPKRSANVGPGVNFDATRGYADAKF
jgi:hypothetical protein